jgi:GAF domain-containing protein
MIIIRSGDEFEILHSRIFPEQEDRMRGQRVPLNALPFWAQLERGQPVRIADVTADTLMAQAFRLVQRSSLDRIAGTAVEDVVKEIRSWLAVPLQSKNGVIGVLTLAHDQADYYSERHTRMVTAIAAQAAVAIENARLFTETQQRTRELSALLRVSNSIASTLKPGPLVAVVLEQLRTVIDNNGASILELYGQDLVVMDYDESAAAGNGAGFVARGVGRPRLRFRISEAPEIWERMLAHEVLIIDDVLADDVYAAGFRRAAGDRLATTFSHVRAWMAVPMILRDRVIGILALSHGKTGYFGQEHAGLARAIADQAAVAIDNARLFSETERRASEMTALVGLSHTIGSTLELRPLVAVILEQLRTIVPYTGGAILELRGDRMGIVDWQIPSGTEVPRDLEFSLLNAPGLMEYIDRREAMVIRNVHDERDSLASQFRATVGEGMMGTVFRGIASLMGVPLIAKDTPIGLLTLSSTGADFFTPDRVRAVSLVANQAAVALENAHLYEEADARTRELSALLDVSGAVASTL